MSLPPYLGGYWLPQQAMYSGKDFRRKSHGEFELVIAFKNVPVPFPFAEGFPIDESL